MAMSREELIILIRGIVEIQIDKVELRLKKEIENTVKTQINNILSDGVTVEKKNIVKENVQHLNENVGSRMEIRNKLKNSVMASEFMGGLNQSSTAPTTLMPPQQSFGMSDPPIREMNANSLETSAIPLQQMAVTETLQNVFNRNYKPLVKRLSKKGNNA